MGRVGGGIGGGEAADVRKGERESFRCRGLLAAGLSGLSISNLYAIRFASKNENGLSEWSEPVEFQTKMDHSPDEVEVRGEVEGRKGGWGHVRGGQDIAGGDGRGREVK